MKNNNQKVTLLKALAFPATAAFMMGVSTVAICAEGEEDAIVPQTIEESVGSEVSAEFGTDVAIEEKKEETKLDEVSSAEQTTEENNEEAATSDEKEMPKEQEDEKAICESSTDSIQSSDLMLVDANQPAVAANKTYNNNGTKNIDETKRFIILGSAMYELGDSSYGSKAGAQVSTVDSTKLKLNSLVGKEFTFEQLGKLMKKASSFNGEGEYKENVGLVIENKATGEIWTCVGFVVDSTDYDPQKDFDKRAVYANQVNTSSKVYYNQEGTTKSVFNNGESLEEARQYVTDSNGILYGQKATQDNINTLKYYSKSVQGNGNNWYTYVVSVWHVESAARNVVDDTNDDYSVDYPKDVTITQTSEGVNVTADLPSHTITVEITDQAADSIHVDLSDTLAQVARQIVSEYGYNMFEPGDSATFTIKIVDNSGKEYAFIDGSTEFKNVDPLTPEYKSQIPWRIYNRALADIRVSDYVSYDTSSSVAIGKALYAAGYGADAENPDYEAITNDYLDDYYLAYLNKVNGTNYNNFTQFTSVQLTALAIDTSVETSTTIRDLFTLEPETNEAVKSLLYYMMYQNQITINGDGVYSLQNDASNVETGLKSALMGDVYDMLMHFDANREYQNGNAYQNTRWGFAIQFDLEATAIPEEPEEPEEPKTPEKPETPETPKPTEVVVKKTTVQTGVQSSVKALIGMMGISLAGVVALDKKRKK